jgi:hypothetical protein
MKTLNDLAERLRNSEPGPQKKDHELVRKVLKQGKVRWRQSCSVRILPQLAQVRGASSFSPPSVNVGKTHSQTDLTIELELHRRLPKSAYFRRPQL